MSSNYDVCIFFCVDHRIHVKWSYFYFFVFNQFFEIFFISNILKGPIRCYDKILVLQTKIHTCKEEKI